MPVQFSVINTGNSQLDRIQNNISNAFNQGLGPFVGGNYLTGISLKSGVATPIPHKLGKQPIIWAIGDIDAASTVFRTSWDTNTITLQASSTCTISLWVN